MNRKTLFIQIDINDLLIESLVGLFRWRSSALILFPKASKMAESSSLVFVFLITAILMVSLKDVFLTSADSKNEDVERSNPVEPIASDGDDSFFQKEIPTLKYKSNLPSMRFAFWYVIGF